MANNNENLFKSDIRLFHSGFPPQGGRQKDVLKSGDELGETDFEVDLDEVLMDFEFRVNSMEKKLEEVLAQN